MPDIYDCIVIGKGLVGCAAVKYLAKSGMRVSIIGPDEPEDHRTHRGLFSAHYDSSRATRVIDIDPVWSALAQRSQRVYKNIEDESGINFHYPVGRLRLSGREDDPVIDRERQVGSDLDVAIALNIRRLLKGEHEFRCEDLGVSVDVAVGIGNGEVVKRVLGGIVLQVSGNGGWARFLSLGGP